MRSAYVEGQSRCEVVCGEGRFVHFEKGDVFTIAGEEA